MTRSPDRLATWLQAAKQAVATVRLAPSSEQIGRVISVADGMAVVSGLPNVRIDELIRFEHDELGFALTLDRGRTGCVLLDDPAGIEAGDQVRGTGEVVRTPVGPALLGRVVDPLGRPIDGGPSIAAQSFEPIERPAPAIIDRDLVSEPVLTGILTIDSMFALGRGQRELIIGDRAIGKTAIAVDCIINQKTSDMICVYVAVGQRTSAINRAVAAIRAHGAFERCIVVAASASTGAGLQWIAPFAAFSMAEYFRDCGGHALVVIDDLTKHAATHREIALLTQQPPGREAYPGDMFYVHARLLERAAKLSARKGGGSLTALPIAEIDAGNLSSYIPTNLISITDGQIVLDARLFQEGHKPAIDVGTSVSRVGGKTQPTVLRQAAATLRLDYAQFLELEMFTRFGGLSDDRVKAKIARGARIREVLAQPQYSPLSLAEQVALLIALQTGVLDRMPIDNIAAWRSELSRWLARPANPVTEAIGRTGTLSDAARVGLDAALVALAEKTTSSSGSG